MLFFFLMSHMSLSQPPNQCNLTIAHHHSDYFLRPADNDDDQSMRSLVVDRSVLLFFDARSPNNNPDLSSLIGCNGFAQRCCAPVIDQCKVLFLAGAGSESVTTSTVDDVVGYLFPFDLREGRVDDFEQKFNLEACISIIMH